MRLIVYLDRCFKNGSKNLFVNSSIIFYKDRMRLFDKDRLIGAVF